MAGYGLPKEHHLSIVLKNNLKQAGLNIKVINGSVSGSTSSGGLNRADWSLSEPGIHLINYINNSFFNCFTYFNCSIFVGVYTVLLIQTWIKCHTFKKKWD